MKKVTIYTKPGCPFCLRAKSILTSKQISFEEIDVSSNPELREEVKQKYNWPTVPVILIGEQMIGGADDLDLLNNSGELEKILND